MMPEELYRKYQSPLSSAYNYKPVGVFSNSARIRITAVLKSFMSCFDYLERKYSLKLHDVQKFERAESYGVWLAPRLDGKFSLRLQPLGLEYSPSLCVFNLDAERKLIEAGLLGVFPNPHSSRLRTVEDEELFELGKSAVMTMPSREDFIIRELYV